FSKSSASLPMRATLPNRGPRPLADVSLGARAQRAGSVILHALWRRAARGAPCRRNDAYRSMPLCSGASEPATPTVSRPASRIRPMRRGQVAQHLFGLCLVEVFDLPDDLVPPRARFEYVMWIRHPRVVQDTLHRFPAPDIHIEVQMPNHIHICLGAPDSFGAD